ncbi:hypothetical protein RLEG3_02580 (plasmid) [Rhizobium leguminosarum bv. trifolii WSM1689]|nr:hypothetical protein RLEG3_02580 [Rhizobium leguminosarum bv. trifolii WSM1689]
MGAGPLGHLDQKLHFNQTAYQPRNRSARHAGTFGKVDPRNLFTHKNQLDQSSFVP